MKKIFTTLTLLIALLPGLLLPVPAASYAQEEAYPVLILGGGVGALTSALYLARAGIPTTVIEGPSPGGALAQSHSVQNWPGELDIAGHELVEKIRSQAKENGVSFRTEEVMSVDFSKRPYTVLTKELQGNGKLHFLHAEHLVIALGTTPNRLHVPGEQTYFGKGVYTCAVCDGSLFKDQTVTIVGGGDAAISEAHYLSKLAKKVYILVRKEAFHTVEEKRKEEVLQSSNVEVLFSTTVQEIQGNGKGITHLILKKGENKEPTFLETDALFLAIGATPNSSLFQGQLELDSKGYILLKKDQETSLSGVFAIGDIVDPVYKQAISAAGDGAKAALQIEKQLFIPSGVKKVARSTQPPIEHHEAIEVRSFEHFTKELSQATDMVLVDFYATWCGPCKLLSPDIESWAKKHKGKIKVLKVNVERLSEISRYYGIRSMPTALLLDKQGEVLNKKVGIPEIHALMHQLEKN